ncbi:MAG: preprotein translocase subunit YajC [Planctomycetes bacterium]|nr:preprotein translocase subunit YajC [Planctomycetota bacterium]
MPPALPSPAGSASWVAVCLAQAAADGRPVQPLQQLLSMLPLVAIGVAAYLLLFRPERERVRKQQAMLGGLKKNDRVVTAAGVYGTVSAVDRDHDRVTLRVDESANVKITVTLASIGRVLRDDEAAPPSES